MNISKQTGKLCGVLTGFPRWGNMFFRHSCYCAVVSERHGKFLQKSNLEKDKPSLSSLHLNCCQVGRCHTASQHNFELVEKKVPKQADVFNDSSWETDNEQRIGITPSEQKALQRKRPSIPQRARVLKVAIVGGTNVGKSTLANRLMGWKFSAVSAKVHTTRRKALGVLTEGDTQIVFLDTPGMTPPGSVKKFKMEQTLLTDPHSVWNEADIMVVVVDVSERWSHTTLHDEVLKVLHLHRNKPSILVLNKVDLLKSRKILLNITLSLTKGVVGGKKNFWEPVQRNTKGPDPEKLFERMRQFRMEHEPQHSISEQTELSMTEDVPDYSTSADLSEKATEEVVCASTEVDTPNSPSGTRTSEEDYNMTQYTGYQFDKDTNLKQTKLEDPQEFHKYYSNLHRTAMHTKTSGSWPHFDKVFMTSALNGSGTDHLKSYLLRAARPGDWQYHPSLVTDQHPLEIARMCVWSSLLNHLPDENPYSIKVHVAVWEVDEGGNLIAEFDLHCKTKRNVRALLGPKGETLKTIREQAHQNLMNAFRTNVIMRLRVVGKHVLPRHMIKTRKAKPSQKEDDEDEEEDHM